MYKKVILKLINLFYYFCFLSKLSKKQSKLIKELRSDLLKIKIIHNNKKQIKKSELEWDQNATTIKNRFLINDPRHFLIWEIVHKCIFVGYKNYLLTELKNLKTDPDWKNIWKKAIKENSFGQPLPFLFYPKSSGNLIHHSYHLLTFKKVIDVDFKKINLIFEFGGGYGNMCKLFYSLGFKGKYIIFDLPIFSAIQRYYLKSINLPVDKNIFCISDFRKISYYLSKFNLKFNNNSLFIATWSLSEIPIKYRDSFITYISKFKFILIAYQNKFNEIKNISYFLKLKNKYSNTLWYNQKIQHIPGNYYLFGQKK